MEGWGDRSNITEVYEPPQLTAEPNVEEEGNLSSRLADGRNTRGKESVDVTTAVIGRKQLINYRDEFRDIPSGTGCYIGHGCSLSNVNLGDRVWINRDSTIYSTDSASPVNIGSDSYIGPGVWIEGTGGIEIGKHVHIVGPGTCLYTHSGIEIALGGRRLNNPDDASRRHVRRDSITIGDNVWIGPNCTILPGVVISSNVVVLPNTLVKSGLIPAYALVRPDGSHERDSIFVRNLSEKGEM